MSVVNASKFLGNLIFKKSVQKQTGIMKTINPMEKKLAENKAKFALEQLQKNNNIDINNLSANDFEMLAENIVNPIKNATQTSVKSADILDFRYKRNFAEELADASKKGDFKQMTGIMKVDPKFKEVMESLKASKAADAAKAKMLGSKKLIPDRDVIPYQSPEVQKLDFADKLKRAGLTEREYMDNIVKRGYGVDDAIYARDFYGDTTNQIIKRANTIGDPVAFAGGGVAGLLGERPGYQDGLKVYPKITASESNIGLGDGKNVDLQDLTYGGTLMYNQGPFSAGIEYLKGKDKFDFKDIDDTLEKDTTDREIANLILMMKLKNGSIKFKGNKDNQMINFSKSFAQGGPARPGYQDGNGVADEDAEKAALGKRVRDLMEEGFDFGEAVKKAMKEGYADGGPARQNFKMGKRAFLKLMGGVGAGIAGLKSGLLGFGGKQATKKAVTETVKQTAGSGTPPPYFFKLVEKIKTLGDDITETGALADRQKVKRYKDYELTEDVSTGRQEIQRMKISEESSYYGQPLTEETYMAYTPGENIIGKGGKPIKTASEYDEGTAFLRNDGRFTGEVVDESTTISDDIFREVGEELPEAIRRTKAGDIIHKAKPGEMADGGRIGFAKGKGVMTLLDLIKNKFGKKSITTVDKLKRPKKALDREMFKKADDRLNDKRMLDEDEIAELDMDIGGLEYTNDFDGTVASANKLRKEQEDYMKYMYDQYRTGKLDPEPGSKSLGRKKLLERRLEEAEDSGRSQIMSIDERDELEYLQSFDFEKGLDDLDNMRGTKDAEAAQIKLKYPGISDDLINKILIDDNPQRKAEVLATLDESFKMMDKGMGSDEIIQTFKGTTRRKQATGGRIGYGKGKRVLDGIMNLFKKKPKKLETVKDFVDKRQFLKNMVGNTEKNKKARQLEDIKRSTAEYMKRHKGYQFPSNEQIKIDLEKRIQPILNKGRKLNATGGLAGMLGE